MITKNQIAAICNELTKKYPSHVMNDLVWEAVRPDYYIRGEASETANSEYFTAIFTFLLLVLAAEGVPYEC